MTRLDRLGLLAAFAILVVGSAAIVAFVHLRDLDAALPEPPAPAAVATSTVVLDRDGRLLRPFTIADGRWRLPVTKAEVDQRYLDLLIAYEDRHFAEHDGVDWPAHGAGGGAVRPRRRAHRRPAARR